MKTVLRYAGGKSRAIKYINSYIPFGTDEIISPFIGGGSLEVFLSTERNLKVKGYDIFYHLVNFWNVLLNKKEELIEILKELKPEKECYNEIKEKLLCWDKTQELFIGYKTNHYKRTPIKLNDVRAAAYYFYNHQLSYGPMFLGWFSSIYNDKKYNSLLKRVSNFNTRNNLTVEQKSFEDVISSNPLSLLYLDPPYYLSNESDNKMFKGIYPNPNFDIHHKNFDHKKLRDLLKNHKGSFILSYNDCNTIRNWYNDYEFYYPEWNYSYGSGETRIGKNKKNNNPKKSHEILIVKK